VHDLEETDASILNILDRDRLGIHPSPPNSALPALGLRRGISTW